MSTEETKPMTQEEFEAYREDFAKRVGEKARADGAPEKEVEELEAHTRKHFEKLVIYAAGQLDGAK